jgi:hypothetical protein
MVCIGGMEGVEEEYAIFRHPRPTSTVYVLGETGGAAGLLARREGNSVRVIDREITARLFPSRESTRARTLPPYALIMQTLVAELL